MPDYPDPAHNMAVGPGSGTKVNSAVNNDVNSMDYVQGVGFMYLI